MNIFSLLFSYLFGYSFSYSYDFFNHWQCIGIHNNIDFSQPYSINIGELPLVIWKHNNKLISVLNICKHMGSRLDNGKITNSGCLKCQYHGLEFSHEDSFGKVVEHEGKIFWSYNPIHKSPFSIPFYKNMNYEKTILEIDMEGSLTDCAYNTMDLRHPEYVHGSVFGFGNARPPQNIKQYKFKDRIGVSFDYFSNNIMRSINDNINTTKNFHMYIYPTFSWSKVSFNKKNLIIGVNLLPLANKKTRWYVTLSHNYFTTPVGKQFMEMLGKIILSQDFEQMKNQCPENNLKRAVLFEHIFQDEDVILWLREMFKNYEYPSIDRCVELYNKRKK